MLFNIKLIDQYRTFGDDNLIVKLFKRVGVVELLKNIVTEESEVYEEEVLQETAPRSVKGTNS